MKRLVVSDMFDLAQSIYNSARHNKEVCAVLFFEEAEALMRELLAFDDVDVGCIDISDAAFNDYAAEYLVVLSPDRTLWIEKACAYENGSDKCKYLNFEADKVYVDGRASYSIVKAQENEDCEFIEITFTEDICPPYFEADEDESECDEAIENVNKNIIDYTLKDDIDKLFDALKTFKEIMEI